MTAEEWNTQYPVGTRVLFDIVVGEIEKTTESPAFDYYGSTCIKLFGVEQIIPIKLIKAIENNNASF